MIPFESPHRVVRPTMDETLLEIAAVMARRGTCTRAQVGAIVARDGRPLSTGYNGAPRGMSHCLHPIEDVSAGATPHAPTCRVAVHAEANAVAFAARYGIALDGATLYTTLSPCVMCAQLVINAGIVRVVSSQAYRDVTGVGLLSEAGISVIIEGQVYRN